MCNMSGHLPLDICHLHRPHGSWSAFLHFGSVPYDLDDLHDLHDLEHHAFTLWTLITLCANYLVM